ncbi:MAG: prolyl oligopeptidase family serine peptidase [Candidatus Aegiribacteria sp.]|nr:prolyl oligopeptidase family serine peptidase [Candidatus Aegiribacteria sp.]
MMKDRSQLTVIALLTGLILIIACGEDGSPAVPEDSMDSDVVIEHVESIGADELIPRTVLFGNPERMRPQLSPDGEQIAYIAPVDSVLNLWIMNADGSEARQITYDTNRGVINYFWAENGIDILYMQDLAGEENEHVYRLNVETEEVTDLTPFEEVKAYVSATDRDQPNRVLIEMNRNNPMFFDVYSCNLETGELTLLQENPGTTEDGCMVLGYLTDEDLNIRGMATIDPQDGTIVFYLKDADAVEWEEFVSFSALDTVNPERFSEDGRGIYYQSNLESNTTKLLYQDLDTGEITEIAYDSLADIGGVSFDPFTGQPRSVSFHYLRRNVEVLDPSIQDDYDFLGEFHPGDFAATSRDNADSTWIVAYFTPQSPAVYYLYDRTNLSMTYLFNAIPALDDYQLAEVQPLLIPARDGLILPSYLTVPLDAGEEPLPMVLYVHGGPWARDKYGYEPFVQMLANRGFAVLQVNFRASSGFGKEHLNAGNKEWGGRMQDDLTDAVAWAIDQGIADSDRVVIMGGSYGGYATLAGVTFTPDLYCAGVDFFGPSNLITFRETVPPYWKPLGAIMDIRVGDMDEDSLMLEERSPLNYVEDIRVPMLIVQGVNDPRVVQAESDQMVAALRENGNEVYYVLYENEGHGFAIEANRLEFAGRVEEFLYNHVPGVECRMFEEIPNSTSLIR